MYKFFSTGARFFVYACVVSLGLFMTIQVMAIGANPWDRPIEPGTQQDSENQVVEEGQVDSGVAVEAGISSDLFFNELSSFVFDELISLDIYSAVTVLPGDSLTVSFSWLNEEEEVLYSKDVLAYQQSEHIWNVSARVDSRPHLASKYKIVIDSENKIPEENIDNNTSVHYIDDRKPDLIFDVESSDIDDEEQRIVINNFGLDNDLGDFSVTFFWITEEGLYVGDSLGVYVLASYFLDNENLVANFTNPRPEDATGYQVHIDVNNEVEESNESNNFIIEDEIDTGFFEMLMSVIRPRVVVDETSQEGENLSRAFILEHISINEQIAEEDHAQKPDLYVEDLKLIGEDPQNRKIQLFFKDLNTITDLTYLDNNYPYPNGLRVDDVSELERGLRYGYDYTVDYILSNGEFRSTNWDTSTYGSTAQPTTFRANVRNERWNSWATEEMSLANMEDVIGFRVKVKHAHDRNNRNNERNFLFAPDYSINTVDIQDYYQHQSTSRFANPDYMYDVPQGPNNQEQLTRTNDIAQSFSPFIFVTDNNLYDLDTSHFDNINVMITSFTAEGQELANIECNRDGIAYDNNGTPMVCQLEPIIEENATEIGFKVKEKIFVSPNARYISVKLNERSSNSLFFTETNYENNVIQVPLIDPAAAFMVHVEQEPQPTIMCEAGLVPGDTFYFADKAVEGIKNIFTFGDENEVERLSEVACERHAELEMLMKEGDKERVAENIDELAEVLEERNEALKELTESENENVDELSHRALIDETVYYLFFERVAEEVEDADVEEIIVEVAAEMRELHISIGDLLQEGQLSRELISVGFGEDEATRIKEVIEEVPVVVEEKTGLNVFGCGHESLMCFYNSEVEALQSHSSGRLDDMQFMHCGECTYTEEIPEEDDGVEETYNCKESLLCVKNQGRQESYAPGEQPEGSDFISCGECEYEVDEKEEEIIRYKCTKPVSCFMNGSNFESYAPENAPKDATLMYCGECNVPKVEEKDPEIVAPSAPDADAHFVIYHNKIEPRTLTSGPSMALKIYNYTSKSQKLEGDIHSSSIPPYSSIRIGAPVSPGNYSFYLESNGAVAGTIAIPDPTPVAPVVTAPTVDSNNCALESLTCYKNNNKFETHYNDDVPNSAVFEHCGECTSSELNPVESTPAPVVSAIPGDECITDLLCVNNGGHEESYPPGEQPGGSEFLRCGSCFGY